MDLHCSVELCLAISSTEFGPAIGTNCQLGFRNFAGLGKAHSVLARHKSWTSYSRKGNLRGRWHARWLHTHWPGHAIQTGSLAGWQFIDNTPRGIQTVELQFPKQMTLALVVIDHRGFRRIIANKNRITGRPSPCAFDAL